MGVEEREGRKEGVINVIRSNFGKGEMERGGRGMCQMRRVTFVTLPTTY